MFPILAYFQKIIPAAGVCKHRMGLSTSLPFKNMRSPYEAPAGRGAPFNKFYPAPSRRFSSDEKCDKWPEWDGGDTKKLLGDANPYQAWENERLHKAIAANDVTAMKCVEGPVTMKDGAKGTLRVLSPKDVRDVERFYKTLLARSRQAIQDSPCLNRDRGDVPDFYQSYRFLTALGTDLILGVKAPIFSGGSQLLIAVTFYQRPRPGTNDRECWPYGTIVADGFQRKGLGTELKKAQIECARIDGMSAMVGSDLTGDAVKIWRRAADELNLTFSETMVKTGRGSRKDYRIDLREDKRCDSPRD